VAFLLSCVFDMSEKQSSDKNILSHWMGFSFAKPILFVGFILLVSGIIAIYNYLWLGFIPIFFGIFLTCSHGTQLNLKDRTYRDFGQYAFIKNGKWKSISRYTCIVITNAQFGHKFSSWYGGNETKRTEVMFQVCLMTPDHRKKHVVQKFNSEKKAIEYANKLETLLRLDLVAFNPKISARTKSRRR